MESGPRILTQEELIEENKSLMQENCALKHQLEDLKSILGKYMESSVEKANTQDQLIEQLKIQLYVAQEQVSLTQAQALFYSKALSENRERCERDHVSKMNEIKIVEVIEDTSDSQAKKRKHFQFP